MLAELHTFLATHHLQPVNPVYSSAGVANDLTWTCSITIPGIPSVVVTGKSKKIAGNNAAKECLSMLKIALENQSKVINEYIDHDNMFVDEMTLFGTETISIANALPEPKPATSIANTPELKPDSELNVASFVAPPKYKDDNGTSNGICSSEPFIAAGPAISSAMLEHKVASSNNNNHVENKSAPCFSSDKLSQFLLDMWLSRCLLTILPSNANPPGGHATLLQFLEGLGSSQNFAYVYVHVNKVAQTLVCACAVFVAVSDEHQYQHVYCFQDVKLLNCALSSKVRVFVNVDALQWVNQVCSLNVSPIDSQHPAYEYFMHKLHANTEFTNTRSLELCHLCAASAMILSTGE